MAQKPKSLTSSDKVIHKSKGLTVTLQTWRGPGSRLFQFDANGILLRVRFEGDDLTIIFNEGEVSMANNMANPVAVFLRKQSRQRRGRAKL